MLQRTNLASDLSEQIEDFLGMPAASSDNPSYRELLANGTGRLHRTTGPHGADLIFACRVDRYFHSRWIRSWFIVAQNDRVINPDLERFFAHRMGATITEPASSHVPFISHPAEVVKVIDQAATAEGTASGITEKY